MLKNFFAVIVLSLLTFSAQSVFAQQKWETYVNGRYGYSVSYPSDLLAAQGEADNGDGQIFADGNAAEMRVFGSQMLLGKTMLGEYSRLLKENPNATYKLFRNNFFVVSGKRSNRIFYQKTIMKNDGSFITLSIEYDAGKRDIYDKVTARIAKSFK